MKKIKKIWSFVEDLGAGLFFMSGLTFIFYGVITRYIFNSPKPWVSEISVYLIVWGALLGISSALRDNRHIQVDLLYDVVPNRFKFMFDLFSTIIGIIFCLFYSYYGWGLVMSRYHSGLVSLDVGIPMWIVYLALPISGILFLIRFIERLVVCIRRRGLNYDSTPI